jgi:hypothetical protein
MIRRDSIQLPSKMNEKTITARTESMNVILLDDEQTSL